MDLWAELMSRTASASKLESTGGIIAENLQQADQRFQQMLALHPNSVQTLRRYAQFLDEVCLKLLYIGHAIADFQA